MRNSISLAGFVLTVAIPTAGAVDFGVMETATTVAPGHFKFIGYPLVARAREYREQNVGVIVGAGYGLAEHWDVELQIAGYDDFTLGGADLEWTVLEGSTVAASLSVGAHFADHDFGEQTGWDITGILSHALRGAPLTVTAALDYARDELDLDRAPAPGIVEDWDTLHIVPGLQYRASEAVDLIGEIGLGLNDEARDYFSIGVSYYFR